MHIQANNLYIVKTITPHEENISSKFDNSRLLQSVD